ncbi:MAG TPA: SGNH/GDSL hydrolase family protein, partial [Pirellulales bacterium]
MATSLAALRGSRRWMLAALGVLTVSAALDAATTNRAAAQEPADSAALVECHPRAGWPNFLQKANTAGAEVKIGYLGGSITAQPGWRPKSLAFFQKTFPEAKFSEINAAIGGTGSDLGVFRLKQDVLDARPDLLFVEFATNDGGAAPEEIHRCMEGIVRQTWKALPDCDVCFVYTITEAAVAPLLEGKFQRSALAMEDVAEHYGIPTIHMGVEVARLAQAGRLLWKAPLPKTEAEKQASGDKVAFANDGVHPYPETGHEFYLQSIERSAALIDAASKTPGPHSPVAPLDPQNYERAQLVSIEDATLSPGFSLLDPKAETLGKRFHQRL